MDDRESILRAAVEEGIFNLKPGDKRRIHIQTKTQMDDHLLDAWYKMYLRSGGSVHEFSGNEKQGKKSGWKNQNDDDEDDEVEKKVVPGMRNYNLNSSKPSTPVPVANETNHRGNMSGRGQGGLKWGDRKKMSSRKNAI